MYKVVASPYMLCAEPELLARGSVGDNQPPSKPHKMVERLSVCLSFFFISPPPLHEQETCRKQSRSSCCPDQPRAARDHPCNQRQKKKYNNNLAPPRPAHPPPDTVRIYRTSSLKISEKSGLGCVSHFGETRKENSNAHSIYKV